MEQTKWIPIPGFYDYSINQYGEVKNINTGRLLKPHANQFGVVMIGLMRDGVQLKRSLAKLVADLFLKPSTNPNFSTPIQLNGDRWDCRKENLMWRPRWYAIGYHKQFEERYAHPITLPIVSKSTGEVYDGSWDVALREGLIEVDVVLSILNMTYVWPTYEIFEMAAL